MSFKVNWKSLESDSLGGWTREILTEVLNSGKRPNILASSIAIKDLNFGKIAPEFEILEIGELDRDRFRGIFKITYEGDFHLTLHTEVQANPLNIYTANSHESFAGYDESFVTPHFLLSSDPFAIPLDLKLSDIKINGIGIIVFSKSKGLTLVFRNDPLDSIKVSSTFDTVQVLANFLQKQIENQIRDLFRETLPTLIHQVSLKYTDLNKDTFVDLHSEISNYMDTPPAPSLPPFDVNIAYSSANLQRNLHYFTSRETLDLHVPKFKHIIQRAHLDILTKKVPNLLDSLNESLLLAPENYFPKISTNAVPIDLLSDSDYNKVGSIIDEISRIQSSSFMKGGATTTGGNGGTTTTNKPHRRVIKLGGKLKSKNNKVKSMQPPPSDDLINDGGMTLLTQDFSSPRPSTAPIISDSETSTLVDVCSPMSLTNSIEIKHPTPMRVSQSKSLQDDINLIEDSEQKILVSNVKPKGLFVEPSPCDPPPTISTQQQQQHSHLIGSFTPELNGCSTFLSKTNSNSSSSFLTGVGLGNNYFNFTQNHQPSTSPIRRELAQLVVTERKSQTKSNNYIDLKKISIGGHESSRLFDIPPPPYYASSYV